MHLGIKVGPDNWREKLLESELDVHHVEIYHNFAYVDDYPPLFAWLRERGLQGRLHASTSLPGGVYPTLATADREIRSASADLARRTLDVAAREGMSAVVVHPGSCLIPRLHRGRVEVIGEATSAEEGRRWATEEVLRLAGYGRARGVEPLIENMPGREFAAYDPVDRTTGMDVRFVTYGLLRGLGEQGICLCVDVAHLYTELMVDGAGPHAARSEDRPQPVQGVPGPDGLYSRVRIAAAELAPYARHLHLSTVTPPWNGTDGHGGFLEADYALGAIPAREQLLSLLALFAEREEEPLAGQETWIVPEPDGGAAAHLANYGRLREWLGEML
jgi:sugar phosphate isomerase/epimerase